MADGAQSNSGWGSDAVGVRRPGAHAAGGTSGFRGWKPHEDSLGNQAEIIVLDDDDNVAAGSSAMQPHQLPLQTGAARMNLLQQHEREVQDQQRRSAARRFTQNVIELLDSDDEEDQTSQNSRAGDDAYDPLAGNAFIMKADMSPAIATSLRKSRQTKQGSKTVFLAFHQAKKDSFHPLGNLIAQGNNPGSAAWTLADVPAKITVLDKSVDHFFPDLENFPFVELQLPGVDDSEGDRVSRSEAARIEKFVTRVLRSSQNDHNRSQCGRKVAIMAVDWLRDTHPSTMARSELTGHLYLTPSPPCSSSEDERLSLRLYYASQGAPHR
jgi:hypothetical protein